MTPADTVRDVDTISQYLGLTHDAPYSDDRQRAREALARLAGNLTPVGDKVDKVAQDDREEGYARGIADPANRLAARMGCKFVPVTQEDREAAYWYVGAEYDQQNDWARHLRDGKQDDCPLVQAFAMHRACCALADRKSDDLCPVCRYPDRCCNAGVRPGTCFVPEDQPDQRGGEREALRESRGWNDAA